jgi:hypothetical protein
LCHIEIHANQVDYLLTVLDSQHAANVEEFDKRPLA